MRIGIYPGTFDPIHIGHITFALESLKQLRLDEIVFLPEDQPRGKHNVTPRSERMQQIKAQLQKYESLRAIELDDGSFSVQKTLTHLKELFPNAQLTLLIGSDVARGLGKWPGIEKLLRDMSLAIGMRVGSRHDEVVVVINRLEEQYNLKVDYQCINTPHAHITSTQLRG